MKHLTVICFFFIIVCFSLEAQTKETVTFNDDIVKFYFDNYDVIVNEIYAEIEKYNESKTHLFAPGNFEYLLFYNYLFNLNLFMASLVNYYLDGEEFKEKDSIGIIQFFEPFINEDSPKMLVDIINKYDLNCNANIFMIMEISKTMLIIETNYEKLKKESNVYSAERFRILITQEMKINMLNSVFQNRFDLENYKNQAKKYYYKL